MQNRDQKIMEILQYDWNGVKFELNSEKLESSLKFKNAKV